MTPWFSPIEIVLSLGLTLPLFAFYAWRDYSLMVDHHHMLFSLSQKPKSWVTGYWREIKKGDEMGAKLAITCVTLHLNDSLVSIRTRLKADAYILVLIGFIGTVLGMISAFWSLLGSMAAHNLDPAKAISTLIQGGLATALVSTLIGSILAMAIYAYLSLTEKQVASLKRDVGQALLAEYLWAGPKGDEMHVG